MARQRNESQQNMLRNMPSMVPGQMGDYRMMAFPNGMPMNENLRQKAMQNNRNGFQP